MIEARGLAEAALLGAAAGHLDGHPVEDRLQAGHDGFCGKRRLGEARQDALANGERGSAAGPGPDGKQGRTGSLKRLVESGDIDARHPGQLGHRGFPIGMGAAGFQPGVQDFEKPFFRVSQKESVDDPGQRLRVEGRRTARQDERVGERPLGGGDRNAAQAQDGQDVAVVELVEQREAHGVEGVERKSALQGAERLPRSLQGGFEIGPGGVNPLGQHIRPAVGPLVEDLLPRVGHADLVDIGKGQGHPYADGSGVFADGVPLAAGIAGRLLDTAQRRLRH